MVILRVLYNSLSGFFKQHSDERTAEWFLMSSYLPTLIISLTYIVAIKVRSSFCLINQFRILCLLVRATESIEALTAAQRQ